MVIRNNGNYLFANFPFLLNYCIYYIFINGIWAAVDIKKEQRSSRYVKSIFIIYCVGLYKLCYYLAAFAPESFFPIQATCDRYESKWDDLEQHIISNHSINP